MKAGTDFKQAGGATSDPYTPLSWLGDSREDLQKRTFASAIATNDAYGLAALNLEANILERPEFLGLVALHDLPTTNHVDRLACDGADLACDDVAQGGVPLALGGLMAD